MKTTFKFTNNVFSVNALVSIRASTPLVQYNCEFSPSFPLAPIQKLHPTRPPTPPQPVPFPTNSILPGYPLHHGPDTEEEKDDNYWNYSGPLQGKLLPLKKELKPIWPHSNIKEFLITFKNGLSLNEITQQAIQSKTHNCNQRIVVK